MIDDTGKKYIDWTSGAVCSNLGHTTPKPIKEAIMKQLDQIGFTYSGLAVTDVRINLSNKMAEISPMSGFLFPATGAEANEAAIRIARRMTGRRKIISAYNSYHGGTSTTLSSTGDFRRWMVPEEGGHVKTVPSFECYAIDFIEKQVLGEGPNSIAAILIESFIGSGGVYRHPDAYVAKIRQLCDKYGIVMIMDEVMTGVGRTGKMWGFQHYPNITPDIFTCAKGLSGSYLPISAVGVNQKIMDHFANDSIGWGSTFQAHPTTMACALATINYMQENKIIEHVAKMEPLHKQRAQGLANKYPFFSKEVRVHGLFGCLDIIDEKTGDKIQRLHEPMAPVVAKFKENMTQEGIFGLYRPPFFHCAPPLNITAAELNEAWDKVDLAASKV